MAAEGGVGEEGMEEWGRREEGGRKIRVVFQAAGYAGKNTRSKGFKQVVRESRMKVWQAHKDAVG